MDVVVAGSHGLIGSALLPLLQAQGHRVRRLVRGPAAGPAEISWDPDAGRLDASDLVGADAVIDLAGAGVADRPLTQARKRVVLLSRTRTAGLLATTLASRDDGPRTLLQASGIGAYGDQGDAVLDETASLGSTYFAGVVRQWEAATAPAADAGIRVVHLRTGIVLAPHGGALAPILPLVRVGLAGPLGTGRQYWSWISLQDEVRAIAHLLETPVHGPVNMVTSASMSGAIIAALARALHRPAFVRAPAWAIRLVLGDFAPELLGSIRAVPRVLDESGFVPRHPDLESAVAYVTARS